MGFDDDLRPAEVFIGIGANLDRAAERVREAIAACAALPATELVNASSLYRSAPVDAEGDDYINAVIQVRTELAPLSLLEGLQSIESLHGRVRTGRNAPRTLDLDLLLYGGEHVRTPRLTVPHPRLHERAFVLLPLIEIAPMARIPGIGAASDRLPAVSDQRIERLSG
jgi:2-amino-4-hydroxy-6-hydroxymethyldihydropteridine diphosphokinase